MENKDKETATYNIELLNNGITVHSLVCGIADCAKFSNDKRVKDTPIIVYLGKLFWKDISNAADILLENKLKVTITIEKNE